MTANNYHCKTLSNSGLVCDTQGCWYELLSPTQVLTENVQNLENSIKEKKKKKKCKGNRKLQHFKRKCRSNGMNEELITKLIENRNTDYNSIKSTDNTKNNKDMKNKKNQSKKRKRFQLLNEDKPNVIKSLSQLSISQPLRKETKNEDKLASNSNNNNKSEDIVKMTKTNDYDLTEKFLNILVNQTQHKVDQCTTELLSQSLSCPKTLFLSHVESRLVEFVCLHHIDLIRKINYQVNKFKDLIRETQLFETLSSYSLTNEQKQAVDCLINIRQNQLETFEEMTMLEARIVWKSLSRSIDDLGKLILIDETLLNCMPTNNNISFKDETHQQYRKKIREYKRQVLMKNFEDYETSIEGNEYLYQEELLKFEYELSKDIEPVNNLMNCLHYYLNHQTDRLIREIHYKEAIFRIKLNHPHYHSSSSSPLKIDSVSVYPEAIIETSENLFTDEEIKFLSCADVIKVFFIQRKKKQEKTEIELSAIMSKIAVDLNHRHAIPLKALEIKHFCTDLETIFNERYTSTLSYLDIYRIRKDIKFIHSIKRKLRKTDSIIRVTDKSGIFHIGSTVDYDEKIEKYQAKTNAYIQLSSDPLMNTLYKVVSLLNNLRIKQQITQWQHTKMMPDKNKIQLAYLYFIPKPHKTGAPLRPIVSGMNAPTTKISRILDRLI
ncbi:unnamed protein product [Rotaria magnacalcarata]